MANLKAQLNLTPEEGIDYFRQKGEVISWDWHDVQKEQHAHAFTIAKVTSLDVLRTIRSEVDKAIDGGATFEQFKKTLRPQLQDAGWWGKAEVLDGDTGELTQVQLGSNRRLRTIFQTNVQTSYMAGLFTRFLDNADDRPYWRYTAVMDGRTRPAHAALNGSIFRYDDPVWDIIFPPNGWGCRCRVVALTEEEAHASGLPILSGEDMIVEKTVLLGKEGPEVNVRGIKFTDAAGKEQVFWPDPGWDYNPGTRWPRFDADGMRPEGGSGSGGSGVPHLAAPTRPPVTPTASPKIGPTPAVGAPAPATSAPLTLAPGNKTWLDAGLPSLDAPSIPKQVTPGLLPVPSNVVNANRQALAQIVPGGDSRMVTTPTDQVVIRPEFVSDMAALYPEAMQYAPLVLPTLQKPLEVWLTPYDDGSYRTRYFSLFQGAVNLLSFVRINRDGSLFWEVLELTGLTVDRLNAMRQGTLLFGAE